MPRRRGPTIAPDVLAEIHRAHQALPLRGGERVPFIQQRAAELGVTYSTLHRALQATYGRKKPSPKARAIPQEHIDTVARVQRRAAHLGERSRLIPTAAAIEIAQDEGLIPEGAVSASTVARRTREAGGSDQIIRRRLAAQHANQVWQVDFSPSKYFAVIDFDAERGDYLLQTDGRRLAYKENNKRRMLWLAQAKDAYSRLRLGMAYVASGETALMGVEFVDYCIRREDDGHPMRGIPHGLKLDNGAFSSSSVYDSFIDALGIRNMGTSPMHSASQGLIENGWKQVWKSFEAVAVARFGERWRIHLADYNGLLHEYLQQDAQREHLDDPRISRASAYRASIRAVPLRLLPEGESALRHAYRPEFRTADDALRVRLGNRFYALPRRVDGIPVQPGDNVRVCLNLSGEAVGILVDRHAAPFRLEPWAATPYDTHVGRTETHSERLAREARAEATRQRQANQAANRASTERRQSGVLTLPPRTETVTPGGAFAEPAGTHTSTALSEIDARIHIGRVLADLELGTYADWADLLGPHITGGTTREQLDRVLAVLTQTAAPAPRRRSA